MTDHRDETIRRRAHAIWEAEGRPEGRDREHWLQAEAEIAGGPGFAEDQEGFDGLELPEADRDETAPDFAGGDVPQPAPIDEARVRRAPDA